MIDTYTGLCTSPYVAFDLETLTYVDGKLLPEAEIERMAGETYPDGSLVRPEKWWRQHTEVRVWAFLAWSPDGFFVGETWEQFAEFLAEREVKHGWFYNAPFDFSCLDYEMLSRGFQCVEKAQSVGEYDEMASDFGARYRETIVLPYTGKYRPRTTRQKWASNFYDLRNLLSGGLAANLKSFDVRDENGVPIRKLEMDYQSGEMTTENVEYMLHDVKGLWYLVAAADRSFERYGVHIARGKPDVLTAGALAKRYVLSKMYPDISPRYYNQVFRKRHKITLDADQYIRRMGLLGGGLVLVNPDIKGKHLTGLHLNRYDKNSHYPDIMSRMPSITGLARGFPTLKAAKRECPDRVFVLIFDYCYAILKDGFIPSWRHPFTGEILSDVFIVEPFAMFDFEFDELSEWYDVDAKISRVLAFPTKDEPAIRDVMLEEYARKAECKRSGDTAGMLGSKLIMNSYGGKYAQHPRTFKIRRVLAEDGDYVRKVTVGEDVDESRLMNCIQNAYITAQGRTILRHDARVGTGCDVRGKLYYTDTDSMHIACELPPDMVDKYRLGAWKKENDTPITEAVFLAPKTYVEREESGEYEVHTKGVRVEAVRRLIDRDGIAAVFRAGTRVQSLHALNVKGGKALLPLPKYLAKPNKESEDYD